ncbi:MAG: PEP-CTERM sorting domain-containing protein [Kiritimatiellales bacterium]
MKSKLIGAVIAILTVSYLSQADLLVSDDFSYPDGTLAGADGGTDGTSAWTAAWTGNDTFTVSNGVATLTASGVNTVTRNFSSVNSTVYFSFTVNVSGETDDNYNALFALNYGNYQVAAIGIGTNSVYANSTVFGTYTQGTTHLIVGKLEFNADSTNERLTVWVDPASESDTAGTTLVYAAPYNQITRAKLQGTGITSGGVINFDDIILGTTFTDVIPEPSTVGLFIISSTSLFVLRQFRK